jgi:hypothetical protein
MEQSESKAKRLKTEPSQVKHLGDPNSDEIVVEAIQNYGMIFETLPMETVPVEELQKAISDMLLVKGYQISGFSANSKEIKIKISPSMQFQIGNSKTTFSIPMMKFYTAMASFSKNGNPPICFFGEETKYKINGEYYSLTDIKETLDTVGKGKYKQSLYEFIFTQPKGETASYIMSPSDFYEKFVQYSKLIKRKYN